MRNRTIHFLGWRGTGQAGHPRGMGLAVLALVATLGLASSCRWVISPPGEAEERAHAEAAGQVYVPPLSERPLPDLAASATLAEALSYAMLSNGNLEAAYRDWRSALERVPQAGALPDPRLDFDVAFATKNVKNFGDIFDSVKLGLEQEVPRTERRTERAVQSLAEAQATGEKFRAAKYDLQSRVTTAYTDLALNGVRISLTSITLRLLSDTYETGLHRFHAMEEGTLGDLDKITIEIERLKSEQRGQAIGHASLVAALNGLLSRPADAPVALAVLPAAAVPASWTESELFARAVANNPDLAAMRRDVEARGAASVLAELEKKPDYTFRTMLQYSIADSALMPGVGVGMNLPLNRPRIEAAMAEAREARLAAQARLRAGESDATARLVAALTGIRNADRAIADFAGRIIPATERLLDTQLTTYGSGGGALLDILDTQRLLVDFRRTVAEAQADRLRSLGTLESILGEDLYALAP